MLIDLVNELAKPTVFSQWVLVSHTGSFVWCSQSGIRARFTLYSYSYSRPYQLLQSTAHELKGIPPRIQTVNKGNTARHLSHLPDLRAAGASNGFCNPTRVLHRQRNVVQIAAEVRATRLIPSLRTPIELNKLQPNAAASE